MARVTWTPQALDDLEAVCQFIARDSPRSASALAIRVFQLVDRLGAFPRSGRMVPELERDEIRELIVRSYRLIYRLQGDDIQILTVHHGARLLDEALLSDD